MRLCGPKSSSMSKLENVPSPTSLPYTIPGTSIPNHTHRIQRPFRKPQLVREKSHDSKANISISNEAPTNMALPSVALPGTLLGPASKYAPGPGTHIHDSSVYASIPGTVSSAPSPNPTLTKLPLLSISRPGATGTVSTDTNLLPEVDAQVLARITRLGARFASADILVIAPSNATSISEDATVCSTPFGAQIRREDVRATEKDKVTIQDSFRVGDLIRAVVISLGDQGGYYLSTAKNELGVVVARGEDGEVLVPVSWREVRDMRTGRAEARKVAKPF